MRLNVENGWRGPIEGIAKNAAIAPRGDAATIVIPRSDLIALPESESTITHELGALTIQSVNTGPTEITLFCRRTTHGR